jgi:predicted RNase H-like HicB family nuclease
MLAKGGTNLMTYTAILEQTADGRIWAHIPEIGTVGGAGATKEEALRDLRRGIELWLEEGGTLPPTSTIGAAAVTIGD